MAYIKLLDVSHHNGNINWKKVKAAGYKYAIIRAGYGDGNVDKQYYNNIKNAIAAGIPVGIYWFSYAWTTEMAKKEAAHVYKLIKDYSITLPVFFDWEYDSEEKAKAHGVRISKSLMTNMTKAFCEYLKGKGYRVGYYYNRDYENRGVMDHPTFAKLGYYKWLARYTSTPQTDCDIHQYAEYGHVDGINSKGIDFNQVINNKVLDPKDKKVIQKDTVPKTNTATKTTEASYTKTQFVKDIQKCLGFVQDGKATTALLNKTVTISSSTNRKHKCVKPIQKYLKYIMKYDEVGEVDGEAGSKFNKAVKRYQKEVVKLKAPDGEVTAKNKTWKKLLGI